MRSLVAFLFLIFSIFNQVLYADAQKNQTGTEVSKRAALSERELTSAYVRYYLSANQVSKAEQYLYAEVAKYPNEPEYFRLNALILAHKKNIAGALSWLKVTSASYDDQVRGASLYNLAQLLYQTSKKEEALETLKRLKKDPAFGLQAENAEKSIRSNLPMKPLSEVPVSDYIKRRSYGWGAQAAITTGYDSNVSLLPDQLTAIGSGYVRPSISLEKRGALAQSPLTLTADLNYNHNLNSEVEDLNSLSLNLGQHWELPNRLGWANNIAIQNSVQMTWVKEPDNNFYLGSDTLSFIKKTDYNFGDSFNFAIAFTYAAYPGARAQNENVRDGLVPSLLFGNVNKINRWKFSENLSASKSYSRGSNYRSESINGGLKAEIEMTDKLSGSISVGGESTKYIESFNNRSDTSYSGGLGIKGPLSYFKSTYASLDVSYLKTNSNDANAQNQKNVITLKVSHDLR